MGKTPRNFLVDPKGSISTGARRIRLNIVIFKANAKTGALTATKNQAKVPSPVCPQA